MGGGQTKPQENAPAHAPAQRQGNKQFAARLAKKHRAQAYRDRLIAAGFRPPAGAEESELLHLCERLKKYEHVKPAQLQALAASLGLDTKAPQHTILEGLLYVEPLKSGVVQRFMKRELAAVLPITVLGMCPPVQLAKEMAKQQLMVRLENSSNCLIRMTHVARARRSHPRRLKAIACVI